MKIRATNYLDVICSLSQAASREVLMNSNGGERIGRERGTKKCKSEILTRERRGILLQHPELVSQFQHRLVHDALLVLVLALQVRQRHLRCVLVRLEYRSQRGDLFPFSGQQGL